MPNHLLKIFPQGNNTLRRMAVTILSSLLSMFFTGHQNKVLLIILNFVVIFLLGSFRAKIIYTGKPPPEFWQTNLSSKVWHFHAKVLCPPANKLVSKESIELISLCETFPFMCRQCAAVWGMFMVTRVATTGAIGDRDKVPQS